MNRKQILATVCVMALITVMGMAAGYYTSIRSARNINPGIQGLLWPNPKQLAPFMTLDDNGNTFGLDRLNGKWSFLFFGYTHCPDVCPITLAVFNQVLQQLVRDDTTGRVQMIFVTVDPARDSAQRLKEYVNYFNSNIIGLGGTDEQVKSLASQIGIIYIPGEKTPAGEYYVDHSASVFLVDPRGRLVSVLSPPLEAENILARYRQIRDFIEDQPLS